MTPPKTPSSFTPPEPAATPAKVAEAPADRTDRTSQLYTRLTSGARSRNDLLDKIWGRVRSEEKEDSLIASIMRLTHDAVDAEASSLLLLDENTQELFFRFADGPVGQQLKRLHINRQSGIAGWIVRNGKPLLVNDPERNKNFYRNIDEATGFKTRSIIGVPIILNKKVIGVIEVLNRRDGKDFKPHDLRTMTDVAATTAITIENSKMNAHLLNSYKSTVKAVVSLADAKETSGGGHSRRVSEYAIIAAIEIGLSKGEKQIIEYASILHDVGKLTIPDNLLNKTQELTEDDWELIKKHPVTGFNLLKDIPFLREASRLILYHHERYDGRGYPEHLVGEDIPLGARIIAVADAFDNMTTAHPYRAAMSRQLAFNELHKCTGTQFCPAAVKAFNAGFVKTRLSRK
ncbi:MAG: HD domain-containing phosphohydrolase [Chloroflexota bacterium]